MKHTILDIMSITGAFAPFRLIHRHKVLILTYHRFSASADGRSTSARSFAQQLAYLSSRYRIMPLSFIAECLVQGVALPAATAAITIDDGYRDAYEIAFPVLRRYRAPATLFVVTDFIDRKAWLWTDKLRFLTAHTSARGLTFTLAGHTLQLALNDSRSRIQAAGRVNAVLKELSDESKDDVIARLACLLDVTLPSSPPAEFGPVTWEQTREMQSFSIDIGSHTVTHPILTRIGGDRLRHEVEHSKAQLERVLERKVDVFCYPNGDCDASVRHAVERAGYRCAVTTRTGLNDRSSDPLLLKRIHTEHDQAHFVQSTSGFEEVKGRLRQVRGTRVPHSQAYRAALEVNDELTTCSHGYLHTRLRSSERR